MLCGRTENNSVVRVRLADELGHHEILLFGMHTAPQLVQLAFGHGQRLPQIEPDQPTMRRRAVQPSTGGVVVDLDNPSGRAQRISFGQRADRRFEKRQRGIQLKVV